MVGRFAMAVLAIALIVVAFDVVGAVVCFVLLDLFDSGADLTAYTVWLGLGFYCGLVCYQVGGGLASANPRSAGRIAVSATFTVLPALGVPAVVLFGSGSDSPYVPDNLPLTVVFLTATLLAAIFAHCVLAEELSGTGDTAQRPAKRSRV